MLDPVDVGGSGELGEEGVDVELWRGARRHEGLQVGERPHTADLEQDAQSLLDRLGQFPLGEVFHRLFFSVHQSDSLQ